MAAASMASPSTRQRRPPSTRMIQNFHLVWLDGSIDKINNDEYRNSITELRQVINTVHTFTDADECIDFITDNKEEKIFMIISEAFRKTIVPVVQDISQVTSVYIFSANKAQHEKWTKEWPKVKGIFVNLTSICEALKQTAKACDRNSVSISFVKTADGASNQHLDQLDQSFMYTQILKEILLAIDFEQVHFNEFLTYCQEQFADNNAGLNNVEKLRREYRHHQPIWWYTSDSFLYSMLNKALRMMEVDLIIKIGFFVRDLHNHIATLHAKQYGGQRHSNSFTVYRGQGLSHTDFDQLKKTEGGLISFNNFLSTSLNREVSLLFADSNQYNPDLIGVLFEITIDPSISSSPYTNVENVGYYPGEEEILFSMHSVFRIGQVKSISESDRLWQVDLTLTSDNDPQLHTLTESIRKETEGSPGWIRLGQLMITLGHFNKAEEVYKILLEQTTDEEKKGHLFHQIGQTKFQQGEYAETITFYEKSLEILERVFSENHPHLVASYSNIGLVYNNMGEYSKALSYYEKALELCQKTLPANPFLLAPAYNGIGVAYYHIGCYLKALSYYEKVLEIYQNILPENHPHMAISYGCHGCVYEKMDEYSKALLYYEEALVIYKKSLPVNHPRLATLYSYIGSVYSEMTRYSEALSYNEKALEIYKKNFPKNHPSLVIFYNNIGSLHSEMGEYSKAVSYYEDALEISQNILPANPSLLATSYNNIGSVYKNTDNYSEALSYYEKALEISQNILPANTSLLATLYNNIGSVYKNMRDCSKALSYYEKSFELCQKTLAANHPHLGASYNNIGSVHNETGDYSKALSCYKKALEVFQNILPANHPSLATSYSNIGEVYYQMGDGSEAHSYYERALNIWEASLPSNHRHFEYVKEMLENIKRNCN